MNMCKRFVSAGRVALGIVLCSAALAPAWGQTQTLRCANDLVQSGDSKATVLQKCGEPAMRDSFCKPVEKEIDPVTQKPLRGSNVCETVDEWTYNPGSGQFWTTLRFESGVLRSIRYGDRVK